MHTVPAYVPRADPVWEATRADRGPVKWYVDYDLPRRKGDTVTMSESLICYDEGELARAKVRAQMDRGLNVRVLTYEQKHGRPAPQVRS